MDTPAPKYFRHNQGDPDSLGSYCVNDDYYIIKIGAHYKVVQIHKATDDDVTVKLLWNLSKPQSDFGYVTLPANTPVEAWHFHYEPPSSLGEAIQDAKLYIAAQPKAFQPVPAGLTLEQAALQDNGHWYIFKSTDDDTIISKLRPGCQSYEGINLCDGPDNGPNVNYKGDGWGSAEPANAQILAHLPDASISMAEAKALALAYLANVTTPAATPTRGFEAKDCCLNHLVITTHDEPVWAIWLHKDMFHLGLIPSKGCKITKIQRLNAAGGQSTLDIGSDHDLPEFTRGHVQAILPDSEGVSKGVAFKLAQEWLKANHQQEAPEATEEADPTVEFTDAGVSKSLAWHAEDDAELPARRELYYIYKIDGDNSGDYFLGQITSPTSTKYLARLPRGNLEIGTIKKDSMAHRTVIAHTTLGHSAGSLTEVIAAAQAYLDGRSATATGSTYTTTPDTAITTDAVIDAFDKAQRQMLKFSLPDFPAIAGLTNHPSWPVFDDLTTPPTSKARTYLTNNLHSHVGQRYLHLPKA